MKKSSLFLACCIGLMLFASCKKDPIAPTITLMQGEGYLTENAHVFANEDLIVGFVATGEKLVEIETKITKDGLLLSRSIESLDELPTYTGPSHISISEAGTVTITGTVTDAAGQTASVSINVFCEEQPNAKFVGRFEGNALSSGTLHANITGMDPIDQEFTDRETPVVLELAAGDDINEVVGTCTFEDRSVDCRGTVEGNVVTFEAINDVITFNYDLGGFSISPQLNVTYNIKGTLTDGQLMLDGSCQGNGDINLFIYSGTVDMDATVGGSLTKE